MSRGVFITFEGLDGSGKSTQISRLAEWMKKVQQNPREPEELEPDCFRLAPVFTRQPGGTEIGERIRALTLDTGAKKLDARAEMALMFADRAQAIAEVIQPALNEGRVVVCDRFTDSTEAYQGGGRQMGSQVVLDMHRLICGGLQPDLTLLLLPPLELSLKRARRRNDRNQARNGRDEARFEAEEDAFHQRVWEKYREIAVREPSRVVLIEGELSLDEVHDRVIAAVERLGARLATAGILRAETRK